MTSLSVIIVNYKAAGLILDALESLYRETSLRALEVIVVDNDSGDDSRERICGAFPQVRWIDMGYNAGFARANNAGMRVAAGEAFLLLNPDTIILSDAVGSAFGALMDSPYVACGVQLLNQEGTRDFSAGYFMKGGVNHLLVLPYWGSFLRWVAFQVDTRVPHVVEAAEVEVVDWISGAFLMVKRSAVDRAGMMDEDFFLYAEEVEWCSRLGRVGPLCLFGAFQVVHLQGEAVRSEAGDSAKGYKGLSTRKDLQVMVSNFVRVRKQYGVGWFLFLLVNYTFGMPVYFLGSFFHRLFTGRNPFGGWTDAWGFAGNVVRLWGLAPVVLRGKPHFYRLLSSSPRRASTRN